ncbi:hypothetical protein C488_06775 [Natrinema pellirubrum DSM 15624]|uniref:Uncharacterized protein n=1 Tax=Natrinema pellirubrum (strain DSM 15624 / CIP 106293 / JCM 10476 / NCIMB 786 / 157) TaxID=797303 RepID=L9YY00_NATP1|nr:hypothetical protein C488_06775 [Natrinema pellirubrum DSM 15624]
MQPSSLLDGMQDRGQVSFGTSRLGILLTTNTAIRSLFKGKQGSERFHSFPVFRFSSDGLQPIRAMIHRHLFGSVS